MEAEYVLERLLIVIGLHEYTTFWRAWVSPRFTDLPSGERVWWLVSGSKITMSIAPIPESPKTTEDEHVIDLADPLSFSKIKKLLLGKPITDEEMERMEQPIGECHA